MTTPSGGMQIGTAEREAAVAALNEHLQAGRLDSDEYVDRVTAANTATTVEQLRPLFTDLPAPHPPVLGPSAPRAVAREQHSSSVSPWAHRLVALAPFIALALFFVTKTWIVFLLVPVAGILIYGGDHRRRS